MATTHHRPTKLSKTAHHVLAMAPHKESSLESKRRAFKPAVPPVLLGAVEMKALEPTSCVANEDQIKAKFPSLFGQQMVRLQAAGTAATTRSPLKVGCVLSGGQAAGGHNCICGLYDYITAQYPGSALYGFTGGPKGVMTNSYTVLSADTIDAYRNSGGFTMLASGYAWKRGCMDARMPGCPDAFRTRK